MPLTVNIHHLEKNPVVELHGELAAADLDLAAADELIHAVQPLEYELEAHLLEDGVLVQGRLALVLNCECARCLKAFELPLEFPDWAGHFAFKGEDAIRLVDDCVDLTPQIREDILLNFPQRPLCETECPGLQQQFGGAKKTSGANQSETSSAWAELNKLKLKE